MLLYSGKRYQIQLPVLWKRHSISVSISIYSEYPAIFSSRIKSWRKQKLRPYRFFNWLTNNNSNNLSGFPLQRNFNNILFSSWRNLPGGFGRVRKNSSILKWAMILQSHFYPLVFYSILFIIIWISNNLVSKFFFKSIENITHRSL